MTVLKRCCLLLHVAIHFDTNMANENRQRNTTIAFTFSKTGMMRYISHLDVMRLMMRVVRRANVPFYLTQGFHPHPKIRITRALKLGVESLHEEAEIVLTRAMKPKVFSKKMNRQFPEGIKIEKAFLLR